jgi:hypothetical protein
MYSSVMASLANNGHTASVIAYIYDIASVTRCRPSKSRFWSLQRSQRLRASTETGSLAVASRMICKISFSSMHLTRLDHCTQYHVIALSTEGGNQSCPEASMADRAVQIIRLFEQPSLGFSESNRSLVFVVFRVVIQPCAESVSGFFCTQAFSARPSLQLLTTILPGPLITTRPPVVGECDALSSIRSRKKWHISLVLCFALLWMLIGQVRAYPDVARQLRRLLFCCSAC